MTNSKGSANDVRSLLRRGLLAARAGDHTGARRWFEAALEADPDNIVALLWLAWLAPTRQESLILLSRVLELDPKHERARAGIRWARRRSVAADQPSTVETSSPTPLQEFPGRSDLLGDSFHSPEAQEGSRKGIAAQRARRLIGPLGLLLAVAACLFASGVVLIAWYSPTTVLAWVLPTADPTVAPTPTFTSTPTASLTASATSTPTYTPSPTPTTVATNTPAPTATPTLAPGPMPTPTMPPPSPTATPVPAVSPPVAGDEKWIDVDLTQQRVTAYEGNTPVFQGIASTGLPNTPTVVGQFRVYWKLSATDMAGPGYYLPGVPYTMYFYRGYALHGTYWHSNFGQPMSHGCVNLRTEDAQWLFNWADPPLPAGASNVRSSDSNLGTLVVVHY